MAASFPVRTLEDSMHKDFSTSAPLTGPNNSLCEGLLCTMQDARNTTLSYNPNDQKCLQTLSNIPRRQNCLS